MMWKPARRRAIAVILSFVKANNGGTPIGSAIAAYPASGGGFVAGPTSCRLS